MAIQAMINNVGDGAQRGFKAGMKTYFTMMAASMPVRLINRIFGTSINNPLNATAMGASILAGTIFGAGAGLVGINPDRTAEIATSVTLICYAGPLSLGENNILSSLATQIGQRCQELSFQLTVGVGPACLSYLRNVARRLI